MFGGPLAEVIPDQHLGEGGIGIGEHPHTSNHISGRMDCESIGDAHEDVVLNFDVKNAVSLNTMNPDIVEHVVRNSDIVSIFHVDAVGLAIQERSVSNL